MQECSEVDETQTELDDTQAVELSIVILVDGEEKCCSKIGRPGSRGQSSCQSSRATTPGKQTTSSTSLPSSRSQKKICQSRCPHHGHDCPYEENLDMCGNCGQPRIIPTPQSFCPCAAYQNAPCGGGAPIARVKSQTAAACQTISYGECQTDPMQAPMQQMQAPMQQIQAPLQQMQPCMPQMQPSMQQIQAPMAQMQPSMQQIQAPMPQTMVPVQTVASGTKIQTTSCQTVAVAPVQARPCTPKKKKVCQKKAKSAICQTYDQPQPVMARPQTAEQQTMVIQSQVQTSVCAPVPVCQPVQPVCGQPKSGSAIQIQQTSYTVIGPAETAPPMEAPAPIEDFSRRVQPKEEKVRKVHRHSKEEKLRDPPEARRARRSSLPPEQLNFSHFPTVQLTFVDYFLKSEGGVASVVSLAETKLEYEKKCKSVLASMPGHKRSDAEQFFNKIIEAIQVKVPESNNTEIKHYNLGKYLQPIVDTLNLQAHDEVHNINKYHHYIMSVVNFMEDRLRERQVINPDAMVDVETHLLAGIMSRLYPIFIKIKEALVRMQRDQRVPADDFVKQLRKLILAIYVEIVCIDVTFNNTLTSLSYLPSVEVQEKYRHQMAIRKKHARHSVTWAARCITTILLYYHVGAES